jgi:hypothetical protein
MTFEPEAQTLVIDLMANDPIVVAQSFSSRQWQRS